jgi:hypothetical protein
MSSPELVSATLRKLRRYGFGDEPILDERGDLKIVYFARRSRSWREVVVVDPAASAYAYRLRAGDAAGHPLHFDRSAIDHLVPKADVVTVVNTLLAS